MPLATYADLQAEVAAWLRRTDLTAEIPTFITLAEAQMNRRLRVRPMAARAAMTWSAEYADLPADFLAEREATVTAGGVVHRLAYATPDEMDAGTWTALTGRPRFYGLYGGQMRLYPSPDQAYAGELVYLQALAPLSDAQPSNWVLAAHPDAYLYGALAQSAPYLKADDRLQTWTALFGAVLADIEAADRTGSAARLMSDAPRARSRSIDIINGI